MRVINRPVNENGRPNGEPIERPELFQRLNLLVILVSDGLRHILDRLISLRLRCVGRAGQFIRSVGDVIHSARDQHFPPVGEFEAARIGATARPTSGC